MRLPGRIALLAVVLVASSVPAAPAGAVIGGDEADAGEWPWQVALEFDGDVLCGGSLVALDVVLTAAHCTDGSLASDLQVLAGTIDLEGGDGERRDVREIRQHEDYDADLTTNDISLLFLDEPFEASDSIRPVRLPDADTEADVTEEGDPAVVTGFGATTEDGDISPVLREGEVRIIGDARCQQEYADDEVVAGTEVCAGLDRGHVDACFGDSGGPLVVPDETTEEDWLLVGIVSWGDGCGRAFSPTVYTEVASFDDWMTENGFGRPTGEVFDAAQPIRVPAVGSIGKAGPYGAPLDVVGVDGEVARVAVELHGVRHGRPADLDVWLVAPDGRVVTLLSDCGGDEPLTGAELVVTVDGPDAGDGPLPLELAPCDREVDPQRGGRPAVALDDLVGADPNGTWRLLVADDEAGETGSIDGWSLVLG